ncbi:MAG: radical SAM protein, partial [Rhodobacteraceae bacterium]|nr:radical SAM protein [Paracoccaceae bacterium]
MSRQSSKRFVHLGCRLNGFESEAMREIVRQKGLEDVTVVNTCAVTAEAVRKSRQAIRRMHRERPGSHLVATGCAVQIDSESFNVMAEVDTILGNSRKLDPEAWDDIFARRALRDMVPDIMTASSRNRMISGFGSRSRAQIQIQNGCDHRCTFCIIPYGRGNSRSVALADIVEQAQVLSANGYNEIVLSGVDITAWGTDLPDSPLLGDLVQSILDQVSDLRRLRPSPVAPLAPDDQLVEFLATAPRLMPHSPLSVPPP